MDILGFFRDMFNSVLSKIPVVSSEVGAVLLSLIVVVLLGLLIYFFVSLAPGRNASPTSSPQTLNSNTTETINILKAELEKTQKQLHAAETDPEFTPVEKLYFNVNGIANSGLMLSLSLLVYESFRLHRKPPINLDLIIAEVGRLMAVLGFTILVSGIVVYFARLEKGRSWARINRAFAVSFVLSVAAFLVFVFVVSPIP